MASIVIAFAMYSRLPMPRVDWNEKNMKYAMCWFPAIGLVIGAMEYGLWFLCGLLNFGVLFRSVLMVMLPIFVTGGIHMDGFMDTMDALSSHQERERKLEILKDSHTGAFAILGCVVYLLLSVAVWSEMTEEILPVALVVFPLSRALSGMAVVSFKGARKNGLLYTFADGAHKTVVRGTLACTIVVCVGTMIWLNPVMGLLSACAAGLVFLYYRIMSYRQFGGTTGDLAGYFLQLCELLVPAAAVIAAGIGGVL